MAHPEEVLAAVLASWGNAVLRRGASVPWSDLEKRVETDLTGHSAFQSRARFHDADGSGRESAAEWLAGLKEDGAFRLGLLSVPAPEPWHRSAPFAGLIDDRRAHAFAGTGGVVLAAEGGRRLRRFRTRVWQPPATTLSKSDVLAFIAGRETADALRDALLWEDANNLHVTDGTDWARFVQALRPEHDPELVHAMDRVVSNTRFTQGEADAWYALRKAHANPDCAWQYDFVRIPDVEGWLDAEPVVVQSKRLAAALVAIEGFARVSGETFWADAFRAAHTVLDGAEATERVRGWFEGTGMAPEAFRLLAASVAADVFGGMGSWNDLSPKDEAGYARVSADLFRALQPSLICAVNSTAGPGRST